MIPDKSAGFFASPTEVAAACERLRADGATEVDLAVLAEAGFTLAVFDLWRPEVISVRSGDDLRNDHLPQTVELCRVAHDPFGPFWATTWVRAWGFAMAKLGRWWKLSLPRSDPRLVAKFVTVTGFVTEYIVTGSDLPIIEVAAFDPTRELGSVEADST